MTRARYIWLALIIVLMGVTLFQMLRTTRQRNHVLMVRDSVQALRTATDSCSTTLEQRKAEMSAYAERVDSLRERVRDLEALHARGVPADSYEVYLTAFEGYNRGAAAWDTPAAALRTTLQSCRALAERHNVLVDSLRTLLRD